MNIHDQLYTIISDSEKIRWEIWQPKGIAVVIGYSQDAQKEANVFACRSDGVPIIRRRGGGGAVVLMPGVLCITIAFQSTICDSPYFFFQKINELLIDILSNQFDVKNLAYNGISDISIGGKKILGCSIFKSRNLYFYQGSLLIDPEFHRITQYLLHPTKEPDYRNGRSHIEFLTSLKKEGYEIPLPELIQTLENEFTKNLAKTVMEDGE